MDENIKDLMMELEIATISAHDESRPIPAGAMDKLEAARAALRAAIARREAEIARLSGIIRAVEWVRYNQEYAVSDGFLACPICNNDFLLGHQDECPFYKWEGDA